MKKKILIIGFGNIGYRHFQSLYKKRKQYTFYLYDKNINNILKKIKSQNNIKVLTKLLEKNIKNIKFDLIIIATTSFGRYEILKKIIGNIKFKYMLIEKFLFNKKKL